MELGVDYIFNIGRTCFYVDTKKLENPSNFSNYILYIMEKSGIQNLIFINNNYKNIKECISTLFKELSFIEIEEPSLSIIHNSIFKSDINTPEYDGEVSILRPFKNICFELPTPSKTGIDKAILFTKFEKLISVINFLQNDKKNFSFKLTLGREEELDYFIELINYFNYTFDNNNKIIITPNINRQGGVYNETREVLKRAKQHLISNIIFKDAIFLNIRG